MEREEFGFDNLIWALDHMEGTLLVCDKNRNVVFYNNVVCSALNIPEERLSGANIMDLEREGYMLNSASIQAFETKKLSIKYVQGKMDVPILTVSNPVLNEQGEVELVVALSINEQISESVSREMVESRMKSSQLLEFLSTQISGGTTVVAKSPAMKKILAFLDRIAKVDSTVLLTGETGAGKEVLAKYIHSQSARSGAVFIPVNCAAIPETLMESEFFGYAKGAFTGANKDGKAGVFELADGGTVFLDEIGEMPLLIQAKFLRVIETGEVTRVGGGKSKKVDFRLVAATNRNLEEMCEKGLFRRDLYYRLNILSVDIPPLRDRQEDILPLAQFFLRNLNKKYGTRKVLSLSAIKTLKRYHWPGNVRELRNVIERLYITSPSELVEFAQGYHQLANGGQDADLSSNGPLDSPPSEPVGPEGTTLRAAVENYEKRLVLSTLESCEGNVAKAAERLGLHKSVLYRKLDKYRQKGTIRGQF